MEKQSKLVQILSTASVWTNLAANLNLLDRSTVSNNLYPVIGSLVAFFPWIFKSRYIESYEKHLEYKRKIYAPITDFNYRLQPTQNGHYEMQPYLSLTWNL